MLKQTFQEAYIKSLKANKKQRKGTIGVREQNIETLFIFLKLSAEYGEKLHHHSYDYSNLDTPN